MKKGEEALLAVIHRLRRPQAPPPPQGLPGDLCDRLEATLLTCAPDDYEPLFVDARLAPWRESLKRPHSRIDQARALIDTLFDHYDADDENALILFLVVLGERTSPRDACFRRLNLLTAELRQCLRSARV